MAFGITAFAESPFAATGSQSINVQLTGQELTLQESNLGVVIDVVVSVTGQSMAITEGDVGIFAGVEVPITGQTLSANLNSVSTIGIGNVSLTGQELTITQGTAQAFTDVVTEDVTGIGMTMAQGSVITTANANLTLSGFDLTMQEDNVTVGADANVTLTGEAITATLGTAVLDANSLIDLSGFDLTMQEGQATATDSVARPTGIEMTMAEGSIQNIIWNPVDTGNAPIDPPGWKEVA